MTSQQILQADLLDILFEHRNKSYGAYFLRKTYEKQLLKAIFFAPASVFLLLFFLGSTKANRGAGREKERVVVVEQFVAHEPKKPEPPKLPETPKVQPVKQQLFTTNIAITPKDIVNPLPPQDLFETTAVFNQTVGGTEATSFQSPVNTEMAAKESGNGKAMPEEKKELIPDVQPQFPGGMAAWTLFLRNNLVAPEELENGEKKTAVIRFHVAEDGSITNFQVEKSAGRVFDEEVIRVLRKMPKWTPAIKGGQPISVGFTQAVTFVGADE